MLTIELSQEEIERIISWFWVVENESFAYTKDFKLAAKLHQHLGKPVPKYIQWELQE